MVDPRRSGKRGPTKSILAGAVVSLLLCAGILTPSIWQAREAARVSSCNCNLKQIGLALHNYKATYGTLPPAYVADEQGRPMHSWRVLLLPFLDQVELYEAYDFSEPWNGPNNSKLLNRIPKFYICPSWTPRPPSIARSPIFSPLTLLACTGTSSVPHTITTTSYAAAFGPHCAFRGATGVAFDEFPDGVSNTVMIGEAAGASIPWTKPEDIDVAKHPKLNDPQGFSSDHHDRVQFSLGDGSVRSLHPAKIDQATVNALFTRDQHDQLGEF